MPKDPGKAAKAGNELRKNPAGFIFLVIPLETFP
jgi:hypothetical protein